MNLFLELLGKRGDGYHELQTVMVAIDRCDALRITRTERPGVELVCSWSPSASAWRQRLPEAPAEAFELPPAEKNLVVRALQRFSEVFGCEGGFTVALSKRIPAGAGMGGASSDAASALLAAAALCGESQHDARLYRIAAELGSDIPFFLGGPHGSESATETDEKIRSGAALASGRGERLQLLRTVPHLHIVVIFPPEPLSTPQVFARCRIPAEPRSAEGFAREFTVGKPGKIPPMFNRLTEPARQMSPWIERAIDALGGVGLRGATMTGSGSACFAIAGSARSARRAASLLTARRLGVCFAASSAHLPAPILKNDLIPSTG